MEFDLSRTIALMKGGLLDREPTWQGYLAEEKPWLSTLGLLTLPMIVICGFVAYLLSLLFSSFAIFPVAGLGATILSWIVGVLGVGLFSAAAWLLARSMGGKDSFDRAFAAVSLGLIPTYLGNIAGAVPWIGWLVALAAFIFSLVCLYRTFQLFLEIPDDKRVMHFVITLIVSLLISVVLGAVLGVGALTRGVGSDVDYGGLDELRERTENYTGDNDDNGPDVLGIGRQTDYIDAATNDDYSPPDDGRLTDKQVQRTVHYLAKTKEMRDSVGDKFKEFGEEGEKEPSLGDFLEGMRGVMDIGTAEMQVVKSGGGNWAEHEWVKEQLFAARLHQDLDDDIAHNFELYQRYAEQLDGLL